MFKFQITTNKMQRFLIYFLLQTLYMFQAVPPPIIRTSKLYIQLQVLSTSTAATVDEMENDICHTGLLTYTMFHLIHDSS